MPDASFIAVNAQHASDPTIPAHVDGDTLGCWIETTSGAITGMAGWVKRAEIPNNAGTSQWTLYTRYVDTGEAPVATPNFGGGSNHTTGKCFVMRDVDPDDPILDIATNQSLAAGTSLSLPGLMIRGQTNTLVMQGFSWATDVATPSSSAWANATLASITLRSEDGTATGDGGGVAFATGVLVADESHTGYATVTVTSVLIMGFCVAWRNAPDVGTFIVADDIVIDGAPAPDGGNVDIIDWTRAIALGVIETSATIAGGDGEFTALVREPTHNYRAVYDNGTSRGCSPLSLPEAP